MLFLLWDASALAKRYAPESGTATVNELFANVPLSQMRLVVLGCTETFAILVRKRNRGDILEAAYAASASALQNEVIYSLNFGILPLDASVVLASVDSISRHNINSTDAAILAVFLQYAALLADGGDTTVLVTSDQRLIRAANAEGLPTLNPEFVDAADVPAILASL